MALNLLAVAALLLAFAVAGGVWWFVRARSRVSLPSLKAARALRSSHGASAVQARQPQDGASDAGEVGDEDFDYAPELRAQPARGDAAGVFRDTLDWQQLRHELEMLRRHCAQQDVLIAALRADIEDLRERLAPAATPPTSASPEYDAALAYARQGMGAPAIAERCGITLAEAELVCAMAAR